MTKFASYTVTVLTDVSPIGIRMRCTFVIAETLFSPRKSRIIGTCFCTCLMPLVNCNSLHFLLPPFLGNKFIISHFSIFFKSIAFLLFYSCLNASIGFKQAARYAGKIPKTRPIAALHKNEIKIVVSDEIKVNPKFSAIFPIKRPRPIPITPPKILRTNASTKTELKYLSFSHLKIYEFQFLLSFLLQKPA